MTFRGALAYKSGNQTGVNFTAGATNITFDTELYDTTGFHDNSSNPERMTVPAGVARVRLLGQISLANITVNTIISGRLLKNGSEMSPQVRFADSINVTSPRISFCTAEVAVSQGDYFSVQLDALADNSGDIIGAGTWFAVEEAAGNTAAFSGAVVKKSADQTTANYTSLTTMTFDAEVYDVGGWHDNVSNNSRLSPPSGVSYVRLRGGISTALTTGSEWYYSRFTKNGSAMTPAVEFTRSENAMGHDAVLFAPVLPCVGGTDYFEMAFQNQADNSITIRSDNTWFSAEKVG